MDTDFNSSPLEPKRLLKKFKIELLSFGVMTLSLLTVLIIGGNQNLSLEKQARMSLFFGNLGKVKIEQPQQQPPSDDSGAAAVLTRYQQIAKRTIDWLANKKDSRGIYYLVCNGVLCDKPLLAGESGHGGMPIIYGLFKQYEKTQDQSVLNLLTLAISDYSNQSKIKYIQNQTWNCKLNYEINRSPLLSQDIKNKAENLCFIRSSYSPLDAADFDEQKTKTNLNNFLSNKEGSIAKLNATESLVKNYYGYYASDFVYKYLWKNNEKYLIKAKMFFDLGLRAYLRVNNMSPEDKCSIGEAAVDLYGVTKEQKYLDFAKTVYEESYSGVSPVCIYFADSLYGTAKESLYSRNKEQALNLLVKENQYYINSLSDIGLLIGISNK